MLLPDCPHVKLSIWSFTKWILNVKGGTSYLDGKKRTDRLHRVDGTFAATSASHMITVALGSVSYSVCKTNGTFTGYGIHISKVFFSVCLLQLLPLCGQC